MKLQIDHLEVFAPFMESHPDFARCRLSVSNARSRFKELWAKLTQALNAIGLGQKPTEKWQKSWSDYKGHLKKKATEIKRSQQATGGGPPLKDLTDLEKRILNIPRYHIFYGCWSRRKMINQRETEPTETVEIPPHQESLLRSLPSTSKEPFNVFEQEVQHFISEVDCSKKLKVANEGELAGSRRRDLDMQNDQDQEKHKKKERRA